MKVHIFALSAVAIALVIPHSFAQTAALENTAFNSDPSPTPTNYSPQRRRLRQPPSISPRHDTNLPPVVCSRIRHTSGPRRHRL
jgi:hypothetical protein